MFQIELRSEIDGTVQKIIGSHGQRFRAGYPLMVVGSGPLEFTLHAPGAGEVVKVWLHEHDTVRVGETLVTIECPE